MADITPMMKQYLETKKTAGDAILFFRLGDFYEMFGDDAILASKVLQIALTSRSSGDGRSVKMPMCGVPFHAANSYIHKLISAGYKVAICEQVEDPKDAVGLVKREIIKIVSPGTVLEDISLDRKTNNYLMSVFPEGETAGIACVDLTTGEFTCMETSVSSGYDRVIDEIEKSSPAELLLPDSMATEKSAGSLLVNRIKSGNLKLYVNLYPSWNFQRDMAYERLREHFKVMNLEGFGMEQKDAVISAAGALLYYLAETQKTVLYHINKISFLSNADSLYLDAVSLKNLEIIEPSMYGAENSTLFSVLDYTGTAMGSRELKKWLKAPLTDIESIKNRQDVVGFFIDFPDLRENIREVLSEISDIERISGKIGSQAVNARDLISLKKALSLALKLDSLAGKDNSDALNGKFRLDTAAIGSIHSLLESAIVEEPPISIKDGGIIKSGYDSQLKELKDISTGGKEWIAALQESERKKSGISSLKVGFTSVFGYYIEISKANLKSAPPDYIRKQTLVNAERFITPELKEHEAMVLGAQEKLTALEYEVFCRVRGILVGRISVLQETAKLIAWLDCLVSLACAAVNNNYTRPDINSSDTLIITDGRHPVVEKNLGFNEFISNDTALDTGENMIMVITGPNMAGKSTYMRQVAVIAIMAQAGSFVPAGRAVIGVIDRIFTRVGASDHLSRGQSTFMVEMIEAANILNNATGKSLLILDEIGRGTSTFDGVSIAWAITEYIHNRIRARTLFATHYYELTETSESLPGVKNHHIQVKEWGDRIIFLRKIVPGSTDRSYGIHVARLAGLPSEVIDRANLILKDLEKANYGQDGASKIGRAGEKREQPPQLDLFSFSAPEIIREIREVKVDDMTPVEALLKLKELKEKYTL
jgi:DNA mismatch repair protein MutS